MHFALLTLNSQPASAVLRYPIPELGDCANARECYLYCKIPQNTPACWAYGRYITDGQVLGVTDASSSAVAKKYGFTFPVSELDNCTDAASCRLYCSQNKNQSACSAFAQKKGLAKGKSKIAAVDMKKILSYAARELRCQSIDSCRNFCQKAENSGRCREFALKYKMVQDQTPELKERENQLLSSARNELGCNSQESCYSICNDPVNREKCLRFSQKFAVIPQASGAAVPKVSLENRLSTPAKPCASDESCLLYCKNNPAKCPGYSVVATSAATRNTRTKPDFQSGDFIGPDGCRTEAECQAFCEKHPLECPGTNIKRSPTPSDETTQ